jgi:hypothetical protein
LVVKELVRKGTSSNASHMRAVRINGSRDQLFTTRKSVI